MGKPKISTLLAFKADPTDKRHGTRTGYNYGCRCERCLEAGREAGREAYRRKIERQLERAREARDKEKSRKPSKPKRRKPLKDCCTVPEFLIPLMGKPNLDNADGLCCWCGAPHATNKHHIVRKSAGKWVENGREVKKPTVRLCGGGNASGCHEKAHQGLLHFRWAEPERKPTNDGWNARPYGSGHWEGREFDEPMGQFEAMQVEDGWRSM